MRHRGWITCIMALAVILLTGPAIHAQIIPLFDNLNRTPASSGIVTATTWQAQQFKTDGQAYALVSVTLEMRQFSGPGSPEVSIWSNHVEGSSSRPDIALGTLTNPGSIPGSFTPITFTSTGLSLSANSTYWVVMKSTASGADFLWRNTADNNPTGAGPGFSTVWSETITSGSTWVTTSTNPYLMKVDVQAVPEPSSFVLAGLGLGAMGLIRRRMKKRVTPDQVPSV